MKWQKKLTKKEYKHLQETIAGTPTLKAFKHNLEFQRAQDKLNPGAPNSCWQCLTIAKKLGL